MDFKLPQNARDVAIEVGQSQKPPPNRAADKQHVIAAAIRLAAEAIGQTEPTADLVDPIQRSSDAVAAVDQQATLDGPTTVPPHVGTGAGSQINSALVRDLSLAQIIAADQAAIHPHGIAGPPPVQYQGRGISSSSFDSAQSQLSRWTSAETDVQSESVTPQPMFPDITPIVSPSDPRFGASRGIPGEVSGEFPPIENFEFDLSMLGEDSSEPLESISPAGMHDLFYQLGTEDPGIAPISTSRADASAWPKIRLASTARAATEARPWAGPDSPDSAQNDPTTAGPGESAASTDDRIPPVTRPIVLVQLRDPHRSDREALNAAADRMTKLFGEIADYKINEVIFAMKAQFRAVTGG